MKSIVSAVLFAFAGSVSALSPALIETASGTVSGVTENGMRAYLGIPYAKPPVGRLRWMPPEKPAAWSGVLKADHVKDRCLQNRDLGSFAKEGGSEDCLYLNVYAPEKETGSEKKKPVFVWIHGGGLLVGAGSDYNPEFLVKDGGAVAVTFNYRLGTLGFLSEPHLDKEKKSAAVNYGFMDQTAALKWVKENIAAFGGDPENITIAGESSGGHSVFTQMAAPSAAGLFHKAIVMSGGNVVNRYPGVAAPLDRRRASELGTGLAKKLGCETNTAECLRSRPAEEIVKIQSPYTMRTQIIDGTYLPLSYAEAFESGRFNRVPLLHGSNRDEGDFFSSNIEELTGQPITEKNYPDFVRGLFGPMGSEISVTEAEKSEMKDKARAVLRAYPAENYATPAEAFSAVATDAIFACPARHIDEVLSRWIPVHAYEFADRTAPSYAPSRSFPMRAAHTYEMPYLFRNFHGNTSASTELNDDQKKLSDLMVQVWTHPEKAEAIVPGWHVFDAGKENFMTFALPESRERTGRFSREHSCGFWTGIGLY